MNTMNTPGFNAENSIYENRSLFHSRAARSFGSGNNNKVYMQRPNSENTPGGKCHASTTAGSGGTINSGTYDSEGRCCGPKLSNGSQYCINCDGTKSTCDDGDKSKTGFFHPFGNFQIGSFVRF